MSRTRYDEIGRSSATTRRADREVTALEPSSVMVAQRRPGSAPVIQARAQVPAARTEWAVDALRADLASGAWERRRI